MPDYGDVLAGDEDEVSTRAAHEHTVEVFNNEPHEALDMKCPAEVYQPSIRPYQGLPDIDHPFHDKVIVVTRHGRLCLGKRLTSASSFPCLGCRR